jgi:hypothetical protein
MNGNNSMSVSRYCHCHPQRWEYTTTMLGCSAMRISGWYDGCDEPLISRHYSRKYRARVYRTVASIGLL